MNEMIAALLLMMGYGQTSQPEPVDGGVITQGGGIPIKPPVSNTTSQ